MDEKKRKKAVKKKAPRKAKAKKRSSSTVRKKSTRKRTKKAASGTSAKAQLEISIAEPTATAPPVPHERLDQHELAEALDALSGLLAPYGRLLEAELHPELGYGLKLPPDENGEPHFFGGVRIDNDRARFTLPPLVWFPQLLQLVSEDLRAFLHDGQHFHFERAEPALLTELANLTRACYEHLREVERV